MTSVQIKRAWCRLAHWRHRKPTNGFGWRGFVCGKCGWQFFVEWEDWVKDPD